MTHCTQIKSYRPISGSNFSKPVHTNRSALAADVRADVLYHRTPVRIDLHIGLPFSTGSALALSRNFAVNSTKSTLSKSGAPNESPTSRCFDTRPIPAPQSVRQRHGMSWNDRVHFSTRTISRIASYRRLVAVPAQASHSPSMRE